MKWKYFFVCFKLAWKTIDLMWRILRYRSHIVAVDQGTSFSSLLQANFPPKCSNFYTSDFDDAQTNNYSVCEHNMNFLSSELFIWTYCKLFKLDAQGQLFLPFDCFLTNSRLCSQVEFPFVDLIHFFSTENTWTHGNKQTINITLHMIFFFNASNTGLPLTPSLLNRENWSGVFILDAVPGKVNYQKSTIFSVCI